MGRSLLSGRRGGELSILALDQGGGALLRRLPRDLYVSGEEAGVLLRPEGGGGGCLPPGTGSGNPFSRLIGGGSPDLTRGDPSRSSSPEGTERALPDWREQELRSERRRRPVRGEYDPLPRRRRLQFDFHRVRRQLEGGLPLSEGEPGDQLRSPSLLPLPG